MTDDPQKQEPQHQSQAVWYFIGAVFVFSSPALFGWYETIPGKIAGFIVGAVLMVIGFIQLRKETDFAKAAKDAKLAKDNEPSGD